MQYKLDSKIGSLYLLASETGLQGVFWKRQRAPLASSLASDAPEIRILARTKSQLEEYLNGRRQAFDLPLDIQGSPFQQKVWAQLSRIPYGKTLSYKDIARKIKNENAVRAVGTANGKNPLCIIIPCHRVIASDGSLGGYSGGLDMKHRLLELERDGGKA
jgi:methylated-DNA-[protein]-cysteine S-methyltransferase